MRVEDNAVLHSVCFISKKWLGFTELIFYSLLNTLVSRYIIMVRKNKRLRPGKDTTRIKPVGLPVKTCPCTCDTSDDSVPDGNGAPFLGSSSETYAEIPDKEETGTTNR